MANPDATWCNLQPQKQKICQQKKKKKEKKSVKCQPNQSKTIALLFQKPQSEKLSTSTLNNLYNSNPNIISSYYTVCFSNVVLNKVEWQPKRPVALV